MYSATQNNNVLESGQNQADCWSEKYRMSSREICLSWDYCEIQARISFPAFQSRRVVVPNEDCGVNKKSFNPAFDGHQSYDSRGFG